MNLIFKKSFLQLALAVLLIPAAAFAQNEAPEPTTADRREIVEVLLKEKFRKSLEKTIYLSTANLSPRMQDELPRLKNKTILLVSPDEPAAADLCLYEFGEFAARGPFVSVSFGDCREGLVYDFKKTDGRWRSAALVVVK